MSLNACFSVVFFKIFPGNMPPTCDEHAEGVHFHKKSMQKDPLFPKMAAKKYTVSEKARGKVHF